MKTTVFALCTLAMLAIAPSALACMDCVPIPGSSPYTETCVFDGPAQYCWDNPQEPDGTATCYTTGRCRPYGGAALAQLSSEFTIASVEIRQGDSIQATSVVPVIAELPQRPAGAR